MRCCNRGHETIQELWWVDANNTHDTLEAATVLGVFDRTIAVLKQALVAADPSAHKARRSIQDEIDRLERGSALIDCEECETEPRELVDRDQWQMDQDDARAERMADTLAEAREGWE